MDVASSWGRLLVCLICLCFVLLSCVDSPRKHCHRACRMHIPTVFLRL